MAGSGSCVLAGLRGADVFADAFGVGEPGGNAGGAGHGGMSDGGAVPFEAFDGGQDAAAFVDAAPKRRGSRENSRNH